MTFTRRVSVADAQKRNKELLSLDHLRAVGDTMPSTTDAFLCISLKRTLLLRDHYASTHVRKAHGYDSTVQASDPTHALPMVPVTSFMAKESSSGPQAARSLPL